MITAKHLAVVHAALEYLQEEIGPHEDVLLSYYLDDRGIELGVGLADIGAAKAALAKVEIGYCRLNVTNGRLEQISLTLAEKLDRANQANVICLLKPVASF